MPDFEAAYLVSDRGRLFSLPRKDAVGRYRPGRIMSTKPDSNGYPQVNLYYDGRHVHTTVHVIELTAFAGPCPPGREARHLNDRKTDNRWPENLVWGTKTENESDKNSNGTSNRGERHGNARLTEEDVRDIRRRWADGDSISQLAASSGRSRQCIGHVVHRRRWAWLDDELAGNVTGD